MLKRLIDCFEEVDDPRDAAKIEHRLIDILVIAVCAVVAEADSFVDIEDYGRSKEAWLRRFLALPHGIPSHDTFRRVFSLIDPQHFWRCFMGWVQSVFKDQQDDDALSRHVAIDGKTLRRSFDKKNGRHPLHLVNVYASETGLTLGQKATSAKAHERQAASDILDGLDLEGCLVTLDAGFCYKDITKKIRASKADYLVCLKGNQPTLHAEIADWFETNCFARGAPHYRPQHDYFDDSHGRLVRRRVFATTDLTPFPNLKAWPDVQAVVAVENIGNRAKGDGKVTAEIRHFITSAKLEPERLGMAIRRHWTIENGLNWVMDVTFDEDRCRVRETRAAENLASLRRIALNLARAETNTKISMRRKRKRAAWDNAYMEKLMQA